jgi:hypothetical protein
MRYSPTAVLLDPGFVEYGRVSSIGCVIALVLSWGDNWHPQMQSGRLWRSMFDQIQAGGWVDSGSFVTEFQFCQTNADKTDFVANRVWIGALQLE